jgi:hypothetical protein
VLTIQISPYGRVLLRPEGPPNLYQLRGRWEWVTLLVDLIKNSKNPTAGFYPLQNKIGVQQDMHLALRMPRIGISGKVKMFAQGEQMPPRARLPLPGFGESGQGPDAG